MCLLYSRPCSSAWPYTFITDDNTRRIRMAVLYLMSVALGLGMIVIGAGLGIGKLAAAAAEGIARQPSAAAQITGAVNLPLFLLEGVAILAEVFALLVLFKG